MKKTKRFHVFETNKRSIAKAIGFRIVEVLVDMGIGMVLLGLNAIMALEYSILVEIACFSLYYIWERIWVKIDYGRHVHEHGKPCEECKEETNRSCH